MYDYGYNYDVYDYNSTVSSVGGIFAGAGLFLLFISAIGIFSIICMWKLFKKAGKPGWASIIPIYNVIVMLEIAELPMWYIVLFLVPFANIYAIFKIFIEIAHKFNKSTGFGVAMAFFSIICLPILAFGKAQYKNGNSNVETVPNMQNNVVNNMDINMQADTVNNTENSFATGTSSNIMDFNSNNSINNLNGGAMFNENSQSSNSTFQPVGNVSNNVQNDNYLNNLAENNVSNTNIQDNLNVNVSSNDNMPNINNYGNQDMNMQSNLNQSINVMSNNCPNCGNKIINDSTFCTNCGHKLK